jgi:adenylate cyclase
LFTDVEGFSAMTRRADPAALVSTLDHYFEGMATIIIAHGGIIDKLVGDAVHALFNAATDLEDHPRKAIECAIALRLWAERFRRRPEVATMAFGRTRIGIESGPAIVGDIGIHAKLDYTAHGDAINVAARLERANKELGSSICIGPVAASRCDQLLLRPLGKINIPGRDDDMAVFEPRHCDMLRCSHQS